MAQPDTATWWTSLRHGGLLIAPSRLLTAFPDPPESISPDLAERLRRSLLRLDTDESDAPAAVLEVVLHDVCGLASGEGSRWERGSDVQSRWSLRAITGEAVRPRRVWYGAHGAVLPVFVDDSPRLGIGRSRRAVSRVVHWLRQAQQKIGILTNARQWRLIHAGLDFDAWCEWDSKLWFEEGVPGPQVDAFRMLLSRGSLTPPSEREPGRLLAAIQDSRKGQAELSSELGERVREAVELLIQTHGPRLAATSPAVPSRDIYIAAARIVMRMVVALFAEARDLLPRDNPVYHGSYGLQGLREVLEHSGGASPERLRNRQGAWPRVLALFRLIHEGSHHAILPVPRYGGELFAPGNSASPDPMRRALSVFEDPAHDPTPSDADVFGLLSLLCRSRVKVQQGRASTWVDSPVDFSDLSSEYIGILYEGLLDYELRLSTEAMVFLSIGDEPLLPLARVEEMEDSALAPLVKALKVKKRAKVEGDEGEGEGDESEDEDPVEDADLAELAAAEETEAEASPDDRRAEALHRARAWARRAIVCGKLIAKPKGKKGAIAYEEALDRASAQLVRRVVLPGEWYLVRWGGTRKGAGTFYTRPQLAVPTVQRTLRPLAFRAPAGIHGKADETALPSQWTPRKPEEILALKVGDAAVGSGSFLIASLRFLTDALYASLHHHGRIKAQGERTLVTLAEGRPSEGSLAEELLPCPPDAEDFEPRLRARLKRYVVERCLYGVDIDPLATELARVSLWIETLDKDLPLEFLNHKVKCGNALIGCWLDQVLDYPVMAFDRDDGGDKNHVRFIHHFREVTSQKAKQGGSQRSGDVWTQRWKDTRKIIAGEAFTWLTAQRSDVFPFMREGVSVDLIHEDARSAYEELHSLPIQDVQQGEELYRRRILENSRLAQLRLALDTWCAIWFWPGEHLSLVPTPLNFHSPSRETLEIVRAVRDAKGFFHWELEFPDVFAKAQGGFDALVGNPPWDTVQVSASSFFSNIDPLYRTYTKEEAKRRERSVFATSSDTELGWIRYCEGIAHQTHWYGASGRPFGRSEPLEWRFTSTSSDVDIHKQWERLRADRQGYSGSEHPFSLQGGGKPYTFRLFLEVCLRLGRESARLGLVLPSGIYSDKGSIALRGALLSSCDWEWLFDFENREGIFDIDRRAKFAAVVAQRGRRTASVRTRFMQRDLSVWERAELDYFEYPADLIRELAPESLVLTEFSDARDVATMRKLYSGSVKFGAKGSDSWGLRYSREFNMTDDAALFRPTDTLLADDYVPDPLGRLTRDGHEPMYPLLEGRGIDAFRCFAMRWVEGRGRRALWKPIASDSTTSGAQYYMPLGSFAPSPKFRRGLKVGVMDVTGPTNARTVIAACLPEVPTGHSINNAHVQGGDLPDTLALCAVLNSFVFDFSVRLRLSGQHVSAFFLRELPLPPRQEWPAGFVAMILKLNFTHPIYSVWWQRMRRVQGSACPQYSRSWAITEHERLRLRVAVDAIVSELYGLDVDGLDWLLRQCDYPSRVLASAEARDDRAPKGFWRVDKTRNPELRHTVLTSVAFRELKATIASHAGDRDRGIEAFCSQNGGEGWMLPEKLRLADYGLGHDDRARQFHVVREALGDRFLTWQVEQSAEVAWAECERHARALLGEEGFEQLQAELRGEHVSAKADEVASEVDKTVDDKVQGGQHRLFPGENTLFGPKVVDGPKLKSKRA